MIQIKRLRFNKFIAIPIVFSILYVIYFYLSVELFIKYNMLISINNITETNIRTKLAADFLIALLIPLILIMIYRKRLKELRLHFKHTFLQYTLIGIMIIFFILNKDFTMGGFYKFFFYLLVVSFSEELIFRGYVYNQLLRHNKLLAIILSGFFWGILHAILPGLLAGDGLGQIAIRMSSEIGGGIVAGFYFIYLLEKSESLFIPIFVHAILDYQVAGIGTLAAIVTGVYFIVRDIKLKKSIIDRENVD